MSKRIILFILVSLLLTSCSNKNIFNTNNENTSKEVSEKVITNSINTKQGEETNSSTNETNTGKVDTSTGKVDTSTQKIENNLSDNINNTMTGNYQINKPENGDLVAVMKTTNWTMKIRLFVKDVPSVVNNFIGLAAKWYYKDIIFHRVIKDFMIQWGDPTWTGMWGESIYGKKFDDEFSDKLSNIRGSIAMANSGPNTNWSQFFINQRDNTNLDFNKPPFSSKHAVFGQVYEGLDNVDKIAKVKTWAWDKPLKDVKIISIDIKEYQDWALKDYKVDETKLVKEYNVNKEKVAEKNKNKVIKKWDNVSINYTGKLEDWTVFDSSLNPWRDPIEFEVWAGKMIKWFDSWVIWMKIWEKKTLTLAPSEAYWEYDEKRVQELPKSQLKSFIDAWIKIEVWSELPTQMWIFKIKEVKKDSVVIDTNHALAWKTLIFDIEVVDIK